jgi:four helix bundle protein
MSIKNPKDLQVWQKAMDLVVETYKIVNKLPKTELFALSSQMRRAAVSIPSNIAEGFQRYGTKEYIQFIRVAIGSNDELETQLYVCSRLSYATEEEIKPVVDLSNEVGRMLSAIRRKLEDKDL